MTRATRVRLHEIKLSAWVCCARCKSDFSILLDPGDVCPSDDPETTDYVELPSGWTVSFGGANAYCPKCSTT